MATNDRAESHRLAALASYGVLDTPAEAAFDRIARLARFAFGTPIAAVSLVDATRQWFWSRPGLAVKETPRQGSFGDRAIRQADVLVVRDAARDPIFRADHLVTGKTGVRFYAGAPLITPAGHALGTLCVFDRRPRRPNADQLAALRDLAALVMDALALRRASASAQAAAEERRRAETALSESESLLRTVIDAVPGTIDVKDRAGRYLYVNAVHAAFFGLTAGQIVGTMGEALGKEPNYAARLAAIEAEVWRTGRPSGLVEQVYAPPGAPASIWLESKTPVVEADGQVRCIIGLAIEITEHKATERALAESESRLRGLADASPALLFMIDAADRHDFQNQAWLDYFDIDRNTAREQPWEVRGHPDDVERVQAIYVEAFNARAPYTVEHRLRRRDGIYRWFREIGVPRVGPGGAFAGYAGACLDITDLKLAEEARQEATSRLRSLADTTPAHLWQIDAHGHIELVNQEALAFHGVADAAAADRVWSHAVHPDDHDRLKAAFHECMRARAPFREEYRLRRHDGAYRWFVETRSPRFGADGAYVGYSGAALDVTDQKWAEGEVEKASERLDLALAGAGLGFWDYDVPEGTFYLDRRWHRTLPIEGDQCLLRFESWLAMIHPDDEPEVRSRMGAHLRGESPAWEQVFRVEAADGSWRWIIAFGRVTVRDEHGRPIRVTGIDRDITKHREAEQAAREFDRVLHDIADAMPTQVALLDTSETITFVNREYRAFYGLGDDEPIGRPWYRTVHADDLDECNAIFQEAWRERRTYRIEYRNRLVDGTYRWFKEEGVPRFDSHGVFAGYACAALDITDVKEAAAEITQGRAMLQAIVDALPSHIAVRDLDGRYVMTNAAACAWWHIAPEDAVGRSPHDLHDPVVAARILETDREALAKGVAVGPYERTITDDDGETHHWLTHRAPIRDATGAITHVLGTAHDVTELKRAQQDAERTRNLLRVVIDAVPANVVLRDRAGRYTLANAQTARLFGTTPDRVVGRSPADFMPADMAEHMLATDRAMFRSGDDAPVVEETYDFPDDAERHWQVHRRVVRGGDGTVEHVLTVGFEITALKRANEAVQRSQAFLREIMDTLPIGVSVRDRDGRFMFMNALEGQWFGIDPTTAEGLAVADIPVLPNEHATIRHRAAVETGQSIGPFYESFPSADGVMRTWLVTRVPRRGPDGEVAYVITVGLDVTEQRGLEQRLTQAEKMQAVGQLTGGIAHDFNNLLAIVVGNIELAEESVADPASRRLLATALAAALRGGDLTQRLLAFARRKPIEPTVIDVAASLDGMTELMQRALGEQILVRLNIAPDVPPIRVDVAQFETAILNLAINARDAMELGGTLIIRLGIAHFGAERNGLAAGDYVGIDVIDTGCGIAPEDLDKVFEPFFTTKETGKGTGLGLSMVYGFARQSGGDVTIDSALGKGTTVRLVLPIHRGDAAAPAEPPASAPSAARGETILLVEDEPDLLAFAARALGDMGYRVVTAPNGPAALEREADIDRLDIVVTDVMLPGGMDGRELARVIRRRRPGTPVLLVSGMLQPGSDDTAALAPSEFLLRKPFRAAQLGAAVRRALDAAHAERQRPAAAGVPSHS